ncbi:MAG: septum formation initiator family protein [Beijerinckiaceae bacterium]
MVIRRRLRSFMLPLALYAVSTPVTGYFLWHALNGERGLKTRALYEEKMRERIAEAGMLAREKKSLEQRIALMRAQAVDRDILDEQARVQLGMVDAADVVIFLPHETTGPAE